jgi:phosphoglycolate phosphatase
VTGPVFGHIAFDFDGTLVRSNGIKRDCFYEAVADVLGATVILDDLFANRYRGDRYTLFGEVVGRLGSDLDPDALADRYGKLCRERIADAPEVPCAEAALVRLSQAGTRVYLISATPQRPLEQLVSDRALARFFDLVLGAPIGKPAHLRRIIGECAITSDDIAMVGDGHDDQAAAEEIGCRFIAVTDQPTVPFGDVETSIPDLRNLMEVLGFANLDEGPS